MFDGSGHRIAMATPSTSSAAVCTAEKRVIVREAAALLAPRESRSGCHQPRNARNSRTTDGAAPARSRSDPATRIGRALAGIGLGC